MSIEIIKENFSIEEIVGSGETQNLLETEIYLNIPAEEVEKIIWVEGKVIIGNTMIIKDKILVSGSVRYHLLSKDKEEGLHVLESSKEFNEEINIHGIKEDMEAKVQGKIEYIEYELEENKIAVKTLINLEGQVENLKSLEVIKEIGDSTTLETQKESLNYRESYGKDKSAIDIEENFTIDSSKGEIEKVIKFFVDPQEIESTVIEDRIVLSGEALVTIVYLGDGEIYSHKETLPFNHFLEIPGASEGAKSAVDLRVEEASYEILQDEEDRLRRVNVSIKLQAEGKVYRQNSKKLLIDAYSIKEEIYLEKEEISILEDIDTVEYDEKISLEIPLNAIDVLDIKSEHFILDKVYEDGKIIVEGILDLNIYYIDRIEGEIDRFKGEFPFKVETPFEGEEEKYILDISSKLDFLDYTIKRDNIAIDTSIFFQIALRKEKRIFAIKDIEQTGEIIDKKAKPSIIIYIVQRGDLLWDIAKRYNTTTGEILSSNGFVSDYQLQVGDKIIIEKNLELLV